MKLLSEESSNKFKKLTKDNLAIGASYSFEAIMSLVAVAILMLLQDKSVYVNAVAGVSAMFSASIVISAFQRGMTETALTKVAKHYANGDEKNVWQMMIDTIFISEVGTIVLLVFTVLFCDQILLLVTGSQEVSELVKPLFLMTTLTYPIEIPAFAISINMRGTDDVYWAAKFPFIRETVYILILLVSIPTIGIVGVGISMVFIRFLMCLIQMYVVVSGKSNMKYVKGVKPNIRHSLAILKKGIGLSVKFIVTRAGSAIVGGCVGLISTVGLAALNICLELVTVLEGFEHSNKLNCQALISSEDNNVNESIKICSLYASIAGIICTVLAIVLVYPLSIISTDSLEVRDMMIYIMPSVAVYLLFDSFDNLGLGILQGIDSQRAIGITTTIVTLFVNVLFPYLFVSFGLDILFVTSLYALNVLVRAIIWLFISKSKIKMMSNRTIA